MEHIGPAITDLARRYVEEFNAAVVLPLTRDFEQMQTDQISCLLHDISNGTAPQSLRTFSDNLILLEQTRARIQAHYEIIERALIDGF